jgi:hypothetical protein
MPSAKSAAEHTFSALNWVFGFLLPIRFFRDRIASFGWTVFDRMTSDISRFRAMSSLHTRVSPDFPRSRATLSTEVAYKLLLVAFSICSSRAVLAPEDHQVIILTPCSHCLQKR